MSKLILGIVVVAGVLFLAFIFATLVFAIQAKRCGCTWSQSMGSAARRGGKGVRSGFKQWNDDIAEHMLRVREGEEWNDDATSAGVTSPEKKPFQDMARSKNRRYYQDVSRYEPGNDASPGMGSYNRPDHPVIFDDSVNTPLPVSDINAPGNEAYLGLAAEALMEDLDAQAGRHRFGDAVLPAAPLTDDQFRYTGDFEVKKDDPLLSSPMVRTDLGFSNRGANVWGNEARRQVSVTGV